MDNALQITDLQLDLLKELANIGVGNAATSLSQMLNGERINMEVPEVAVVPLQEVPESVSTSEEAPVGAVYFTTRESELDLVFLFVLPMDSIMLLVKRLIPGSESGVLGEMERSLILELGNIVTGSYLNALSFMTNLSLLPSPPNLALDMAGAIIGTVIGETSQVDDHLILLKTVIRTADDAIEGNVLILPDFGSLKKIFSLLGAG